MEGINAGTTKSGTLDTRPPGWEDDRAKAAEIKASQLAEQNNAPAVSPAGMDGVTPAPASSIMPIGAEAAQPTEIKTPAFALPPEPSKPAEGSAPEAITTKGALGSSPTDTAAAPQATQVADQPTKKHGFLGKLFGKK